MIGYCIKVILQRPRLGNTTEGCAKNRDILMYEQARQSEAQNTISAVLPCLIDHNLDKHVPQISKSAL